MSKRGFKNPETQAKAKKTKSELREKQKEDKKFEQHRKKLRDICSKRNGISKIEKIRMLGTYYYLRSQAGGGLKHTSAI